MSSASKRVLLLQQVNGSIEKLCRSALSEKEEPTYYGAIDGGSNNLRLIIIDQHQNVVAELKVTAQLGEGMSDEHPYFLEENCKRAVTTIGVFAAILRLYGIAPSNAKCVFTAATRDTQTAKTEIGTKQVEALLAALGEYKGEVFSPREEAIQIFKTAMWEIFKRPDSELAKLVKKHKRFMIVHIGGRSTELISVVNGVTEHIEVITHGTHTHKDLEKKHPDNPNIFRETLHQKLVEIWPANEKPLLMFSGGISRPIGRAIGRSSSILSRKEFEANAQLLIGPNGIDADVLNLFEDPQIPHINAAMQSLLELATYTKAPQIAFLKGKMVMHLACSLI